MNHDEKHLTGCGGIKIIVHSCDWKNESTDQSQYKIEGFDDTYWIDDFEVLKNTVIRELERWEKVNLSSKQTVKEDKDE